MKKKLIALLIVVLMVIALVPMTVFAAEASYSYKSNDYNNRIRILSNNEAMGLIQPGGNYQNFDDNGGHSNDTWTFTAVPNPGYIFDSWAISGGNHVNNLSSSTATLSITYKPGNDGTGEDGCHAHSFKAVAQFKEKPKYTVTFAPGEHGSLAGTTSHELYEGSDFPEEPSVSADTGWEFTGSWDPSLPDKVTDSKTYTAQYERVLYDITFNVGLHGTWEGGGTDPQIVQTPFESVPEDPAFVANEGYIPDDWDKPIVAATGTETYTAKYKCEEYNISYEYDGGDVVSENPATYTIESDEITLENPDRKGYLFGGWKGTDITDGETNVVIPTGSTGDRAFTALWIPISYIVTYDKNGGDGGSTDNSNHKYGIESALTANGYYKAGHTFAGWAKDEDASAAKYTDGIGVINLADEDGAIVPLYAVWNIDQFDVIFYKQDGESIISEQKVNWDEAAQSVEPPSIPGYAFDKWILEGSNSEESTSLQHVRENIKAVASYIKNGYTVRFVDYDGSELGTDGVLFGESATAPEDAPAREGYTFTGWDKPFNNITGNLTVTAQYVINKHTVEFVDYNGRELKSQTVDWGTAATAPANPTCTGYTFTGWDKAFDRVTSDLTVTAQYTINKYTVKFVDYNGKELKSQTVNWNTAATAPANPTCTGYTFTCWDKPFDKVTSDLTITAQYAINKYTVMFVDYDGKELSVQTVNWGTAAIAPSDPIRWKYTFTGWDKAFNNVTSDLTVTAQYKGTVSLDDSDIPKTYDDSQAFPWGWLVLAAGLIGAIVWIIVSQARKHKDTGDAV